MATHESECGKNWLKNRRVRAGMVASHDEGIGRILRAIDNVKIELFRIEGSQPEEEIPHGDLQELLERLFRKARNFRRLQPASAVRLYAGGRESFRFPEEWKPRDL